MEQPRLPLKDHNYVGMSLEVTIKVGLVLGLITWCFLILKPFLMITLWGVIIAVAIYPMFSLIKRKLGNRGKIAAVLVTLFLLLLILVPILLLGGSRAAEARLSPSRFGHIARRPFACARPVGGRPLRRGG